MGKETADLIENLQDDNILTKKMLMGYKPEDPDPVNPLE